MKRALALLSAAALIALFAGWQIGRRPDLPPEAAAAPTLPLPSHYWIYADTPNEPPRTLVLNWEAGRLFTEDDDPCGIAANESYRSWQDGSGQAQVFLWVCRTPAPFLALIDFQTRAIVDALAPLDLPDSVVGDVRDGLPAGLAADRWRLACVLGETIDGPCRMWLLRAQYGQYVMSLEFSTIGVVRSGIGLDSFEPMIRAADAYADASLR